MGFGQQFYLLLIHEQVHEHEQVTSVRPSIFSILLLQRRAFRLRPHKYPAYPGPCNVVSLKGDHVPESIWKILGAVPVNAGLLCTNHCSRCYSGYKESLPHKGDNACIQG